MLTVAGLTVTEIADQVGTPAYVVDEADLRARARAFADAFAGWDVYYAGEVVPVHRGRPLGGRGGARHRRLHAAASSPWRCGPASTRDTIGLHGNNKSVDGARSRPWTAGVGRIIVDSFDEIDRLGRLVRPSSAYGRG